METFSSIESNPIERQAQSAAASNGIGSMESVRSHRIQGANFAEIILV
jgi:hypothetical protein